MEQKNEMMLTFDSRSSNESFARVAVAAFTTQLNPTLEEVADIKTAVSCLESGENGCERAAQCLTLPMWKKLDAVMDNYLSGVSVQDLLDGKA